MSRAYDSLESYLTAGAGAALGGAALALPPCLLFALSSALPFRWFALTAGAALLFGGPLGCLLLLRWGGYAFADRTGTVFAELLALASVAALAFDLHRLGLWLLLAPPLLAMASRAVALASVRRSYVHARVRLQRYDDYF